MKPRLLASFLATTAVVGALSVPSGASTTPYAQMKHVIADIKKEESARVIATLTMAGKRLVNTTDAASIGGHQTIVLTVNGKSNTVNIELVNNGGLYVKGDEAILIAYMGFPKTTATQLSDQWFTIPKSNADYAEVAQGLTLNTIAAELTMNEERHHVGSHWSLGLRGVKGNDGQDGTRTVFSRDARLHADGIPTPGRGLSDLPGLEVHHRVQSLEREGRR